MSRLFLVTDWWKSWAFFCDWSTNFAFFPITSWEISWFFSHNLLTTLAIFYCNRSANFIILLGFSPRSTDNFYDFSRGFSTNFAFFFTVTDRRILLFYSTSTAKFCIFKPVIDWWKLLGFFPRLINKFHIFSLKRLKSFTFFSHDQLMKFRVFPPWPISQSF